MYNLVLIGNKNYSILKLDQILDSFAHNIRFNFGVPNNNNGTKYDAILLNNHVYHYAKRTLQDKINKYCALFSISEEHITNFHNSLSSYNKILPQSNQWNHFNTFLHNKNCPYSFTHLPRVGYIQLMDFILNNMKVFVYGFSIDNIYDEHLYVKNLKYGNPNDDPIKRTGHNEENELQILSWLHNNNYTDATLCLLEDTVLPTLNCKLMKPSVELINLLLNLYGICIIKNYYNKDIIDGIIEEYHIVFEKQKNKIDIDNKENCSKDERIFYVEKYSKFIKEHFTDNNLFNNTAINHVKRRLNKKTLINKVVYEEGKIKNSGAGWYRDNHDCKFKVLMYL